MPRRPKPQYVNRTSVSAEPRTPPPAPEGLGDAGLTAWDYVMRLHWISPERHRLSVDRYCRLQDFLAAAFAELKRAGLMQLGSHKQLRCHPITVEIRQLSAELRALEVELALTPSSASKAGVPLGDPGPTLQDLDREAGQAAADDPTEQLKSIGLLQQDWQSSPHVSEDDPRSGLRLIEGGDAS